MLDALHARRDGASNRSRRKGMRGDIGAPVFSRFDCGSQFGLGEGRHIDRTEGRRHAAAGGQLHLGGALHELFARAQAHFVRAVRNHASANLFHTGQHTSDRARQVGKLTKIAVAAGDCNDRAGRIDTRACDDAFVDRALEAKHRPADIANGREAAHQRVRRFGGGHEVVEADIAECLRRSHPHEHGVPMRVDQAGHQCAAAAIDDAAIAAAIEGDGRCRDVFDFVAPHQNTGRCGERGALAIEDTHVLEQCGGGVRLLAGLRSGRGRQPRPCNHQGGDKSASGQQSHAIISQMEAAFLRVTSLSNSIGF